MVLESFRQLQYDFYQNRAQRQVKVDYYSGTVKPRYIGKAKHGIGTGDKGWQILELTWDGDMFLSQEYVNNTSGYSLIWDNRESY